MTNSIDIVNQYADAEVSAGDLFESMHAILHLYKALQYRDQGEDGPALTHMDAKVLGFFARHTGATQKDLAAYSGRDKGQLTRLISGLKERGLVQGQVDPADRRNIQLELTPEGAAAQRVLEVTAQRVSQRAVAHLTSEEGAQLLTLLRKVHAGLAGPNQA